mmetsp:Transcript_22368/g.45647  ORF Transcript_22368/g.45647 Transcript_22368/m.45647 type:complete len:92 (-) Transcript_22368:1194-1469(-)
MILCGHASRLKLQRRYIRLLQTHLHKFGTSADMKDTFCSTISDLFGENSVDPYKYAVKYTSAIETLSAIGLHHLFMGLFSKECASVICESN